MVSIGRAINGISINGNEWLLDKNNEVVIFTDKNEAVNFLKINGISNEEIKTYTFHKE